MKAFSASNGLLIDFETRLDKRASARILQYSLIRLLSVPKIVELVVCILYLR